MNDQVSEKSFSAFLPVTLIALGIIILLSWNLLIVINQHSNGVRIIAQQDIQLEQANQAESKLKLMMSDLVDLAKDDTDAETIVKRHGITFNPPANAEKPMALPGKALEKTPAKATPKKTVKTPVEEPAAGNASGILWIQNSAERPSC